MMPGRCFIRAGAELKGREQTKSHSDPYRTEGALRRGEREAKP